MTKKELAAIVAETHNTKDLSLIEPYLSEDFVFEMPSEAFSWFRRGTKGKPFVNEYSKSRFLHFQQMTFEFVHKWKAEVTYSKALNQIVVNLFHRGKYDGTLKIRKKGDKIVRMRQCYLPEDNGHSKTARKSHYNNNNKQAQL